jgi:hypothetical protein
LQQHLALDLYRHLQQLIQLVYLDYILIRAFLLEEGYIQEEDQFLVLFLMILKQKEYLLTSLQE